MIEIEVLRDPEGNPVKAVVKDGGSIKVTALASNDGFKLEGSRRNLTAEYLDFLKLVFPFQPADKLMVPQPLSVMQVQGGKTVLFDDMETLLKWEQVDATVALSNTFAYDSSQSLHLTSGGGADTASARRSFALNDLKTLECSFVFAVADFADLDILELSIEVASETLASVANLNYNAATRVWGVQVQGGAVLPVFTEPNQLDAVTGVGGQWHSVALTIDLSEGAFKKVRVNGKTAILELGYPLQRAAAVAQYSRVSLSITDIFAAASCDAWFDNTLITQE